MSEDDVKEPARWTSRTVIPSTSDKRAFDANAAAIDRLVGTGRYVYIVAWGKWLGFTPETVHGYVLQAEADNAPVDVIQKIDGKWIGLDDIVNETNRSRVIALATSGPPTRSR